MSYHLFLDDERVPKHVTWVPLPPGPWTVVRSYDTFVDQIVRRGLPTFVSFDHDLGEMAMTTETPLTSRAYAAFPERTGYHAARWLIDYCLDRNERVPEYQVHSMNPVGRDNIIGLMEGAKKAMRQV